MWVRAALGHSQFVRNKGDIEMAAASLTVEKFSIESFWATFSNLSISLYLNDLTGC